MRNLNVTYIGQLPFPYGPASSKRRRYMVDYMNDKGIMSHVLVTFHRAKMYSNPATGIYKNTEFVDISSNINNFNLSAYYRNGFDALRRWYDSDKKNILIFHTVMNFMDYPFYLYARKLGYKIVFDVVETSYLKSGIKSIKSYIYYWLNENVTSLARKDGIFVISRRLQETNKVTYPKVPLCLLPNSTPILCIESKQKFHKPMTVLYAGTYGDKEGVDYLIEGVIAANLSGVACNLTLLGKAPDDLIRKYRGESCVEFSGFVSDNELEEALVKSDILAMVRTNTEFANFGFPFKLSEYLSTGNVVIATKVGDVAEYLSDKNNAYLIDAESSDAVKSVLCQIARNETDALAVARNGLEVAKTHFAIDRVGKVFAEFLKSI